MRVGIDQSGKIGETKVPIALAFSNGKHFVVYIPATVKRECLHKLRAKGKSGTTLYIQMFTVGLYLLLKNHIKDLKQAIIDIEYPGHEAKIKEHLINLLHRAGVPIKPDIIQFGYVGKKSNAHRMAIAVFSGKTKPDKVIEAIEVLQEFKK